MTFCYMCRSGLRYEPSHFKIENCFLQKADKWMTSFQCSHFICCVFKQAFLIEKWMARNSLYAPECPQTLHPFSSASQVLGFLDVQQHAWLTVSASTKTVGHSEHVIITSNELLNLVPMRCRLSPRKPTASLVISPNLLWIVYKEKHEKKLSIL